MFTAQAVRRASAMCVTRRSIHVDSPLAVVQCVVRPDLSQGRNSRVAPLAQSCSAPLLTHTQITVMLTQSQRLSSLSASTVSAAHNGCHMASELRLGIGRGFAAGPLVFRLVDDARTARLLPTIWPRLASRSSADAHLRRTYLLRIKVARRSSSVDGVGSAYPRGKLAR